jgi:hypothetical protein
MFSNTKQSDTKSVATSDTEIKTTSKLPTLMMTPVFNQNSQWPSYIVSPLYDTDKNTVDSQHYYNAVNGMATAIQSYSHIKHQNSGNQYMYPVMPYYMQPVDTTQTLHSTAQPDNTLRQQQLWYYQHYQPTTYDYVV